MALHHEKLFLNVMCHSGDVSKQDDGGAAGIGPSFPFRVKLRNTQHEQMSSALLPGTDIWHAQSLRRSRPLCGQRHWNWRVPISGSIWKSGTIYIRRSKNSERRSRKFRRGKSPESEDLLSRINLICPDRANQSFGCPAPFAKKFLFPFDPNQF